MLNRGKARDGCRLRCRDVRYCAPSPSQSVTVVLPHMDEPHHTQKQRIRETTRLCYFFLGSQNWHFPSLPPHIAIQESTNGMLKIPCTLPFPKNSNTSTSNCHYFAFLIPVYLTSAASVFLDMHAAENIAKSVLKRMKRPCSLSIAPHKTTWIEAATSPHHSSFSFARMRSAYPALMSTEIDPQCGNRRHFRVCRLLSSR